MFKYNYIAFSFLCYIKIKTKSLFLPIEHVKHYSASVKPANQLSFNEGNLKLLINIIFSNIILPLLAQLLKPFINLSSFTFVVGNIALPLKRLIIISISFLLCVTYLLVFIDCGITLPKPKVYFIYCKTFITVVLWTIINDRSPLLFTIEEPSPPAKPISQHKNLS